MSRITRDALWSFETAQFFVGFYAEEEHLDPADSFEFQDDIDAVRNGDVSWFCAAVRVYFKDGSDEPTDWREVGSDYLGGCAYKHVREFYTSHRDPDPMGRNCSIMRAKHGENVVICHYFPDMVSEAVSAARSEIHRLKAVKLREAA